MSKHCKGWRSRALGTALGSAFGIALSTGASAAGPHYTVIGHLPSSGNEVPKDITSIVYRSGRLYGYAGGRKDSTSGQNVGGGIFSMSMEGTVTPLHLFAAMDGEPHSNVEGNQAPFIVLNDGSLFGVTAGSTGMDHPILGTSFIVSPTGTFQRLHTYDPDMGDTIAPAALTTDANGTIFGLAQNALVTVTPAGNATVAHDFGSGIDGGVTPASLVAGKDGEFFTTKLVIGGSRDTVLKYKDGAETVLHTLDGTEGHEIQDLVMDGAGNLIGSVWEGPQLQDDGLLFKITPQGDFSILHRFTMSGEHFPNDLMAGADGSVYGGTWHGGADNGGILFQIAPNGHYRVLHNIGSAGAAYSSLVQGEARTIYGVVYGDIVGSGSIFKLVIPVQDDLTGSGVSSLVLTGPGVLSTGTATGAASSLSVASGYYVAAVGDFNGDGIADILWTSTKRDLYIWLGGTDGFTSRYAGTYPSGWTVVGSGDFDGDGMDDLAWINATTGQFSYWLMNGAARKGYKVVAYAAGYFPTTVGDYNGDGRADVMWSSAKHDLYVWLSSGNGFASKFVTSFPAAWKIAGRGDLDGDGKADLVWSTTDGTQWGYWLMDGGLVRRTKSFAVPAAVSGSHVAAVADYDGDGVADLLWSDGHALTLWQNQGGCLDVPGCAFSESVPRMTLSAGQSVFNSGLPVAR